MNSVSDIFKMRGRKLAVLIDPDKTNSIAKLKSLTEKINFLSPTFIFVGGSTVEENDFDQCIRQLKSLTKIPLVIFPGAYHHIHPEADGILFLSLISGRNPDFLIGHQVQSAHRLRQMNVDVIPTGYLLIDGGVHSSVAYVSQTTPIPVDQVGIAVNTAIAGEMLGLSAIFLDAGSGAKNVVPEKMISAVRQSIKVPLIIGGGIRNLAHVESAFQSGADVVVIGNRIEEDSDFLLDLCNVEKTSAGNTL